MPARFWTTIPILGTSLLLAAATPSFGQDRQNDNRDQQQQSNRGDTRYQDNQDDNDRDQSFRDRREDGRLFEDLRDRRDNNRDSGRQFGDRFRSQQDQPGGLGVTVQDEGNQEGVRVSRVFRGSPAANAGLRENDQILGVDGQSINSTNELISTILDKDPGSRVDVHILRNNRERTLTAQLEPRRQALNVVRGQDRQFLRRGNRTPFDDNTPPGHDDLMRHIEMLTNQIRQLDAEIGDLRTMLMSDERNESPSRDNRSSRQSDFGRSSDRYDDYEDQRDQSSDYDRYESDRGRDMRREGDR